MASSRARNRLTLDNIIVRVHAATMCGSMAAWRIEPTATGGYRASRTIGRFFDDAARPRAWRATVGGAERLAGSGSGR
jgi:hypothetical protein